MFPEGPPAAGKDTGNGAPRDRVHLLYETCALTRRKKIEGRPCSIARGRAISEHQLHPDFGRRGRVQGRGKKTQKSELKKRLGVCNFAFTAPHMGSGLSMLSRGEGKDTLMIFWPGKKVQRGRL